MGADSIGRIVGIVIACVFGAFLVGRFLFEWALGGFRRGWKRGLSLTCKMPMVRVCRCCLYRCNRCRRRGSIPVLYVDLTSGTASVQTCPKQALETVRFVCTSDTHMGLGYMQLPAGDVFLHSGDLLIQDRGLKAPCGYGRRDLEVLNQQFAQIPTKEKVVIGGNHDLILQELGHEAVSAILTNCTYLEYSATRLSSGYVVFGAPVSLGRSANCAFRADTPAMMNDAVLSGFFQAETSFGKVPIVIMHGPPRPDLRQILSTHRAGVRIVLFGHQHQHYGWIAKEHDTVFVNVASMDRFLCPTHPPVVFDLPVSVA